LTATYRRTLRKRELKKLVQKGTVVEDPVPWHLHRREKVCMQPALRDVCKEENLCAQKQQGSLCVVAAERQCTSYA